MVERAPGGEPLRKPRDWAWQARGSSPPPDSLLQRAALLPDVPMTRMEYMEAMAFAKERTEDGHL